MACKMYITKSLELGELLVIPKDDAIWDNVYNYVYSHNDNIIEGFMRVPELNSTENYFYPYESDISESIDHNKWNEDFDLLEVKKVLENNLDLMDYVTIYYRNAYFIIILTSNDPIPDIETQACLRR